MSDLVTSTAQVDPRIRARRIEVQRDAGRRRRRRLLDVGLILAVVAGFAVALRSPLLDVADVHVGGASRTSVEAIADAAGIGLGDQLMDVDLAAAGKRVAALPWIDQVELHRGLDGVVRIDVVERTAAAVVGEDASALLVDAKRRVLGPLADAPDLQALLVTVVGAPEGLAPGEVVPAELEEALALASRLSEEVPGAVAQVALGDDGLVAHLTAGGEALFGDSRRMVAKVRALETVLAQVDLTCLRRLDVRVPGSPVLTRAEPCS